LEETLGEYDNVRVINEDILKVDSTSLTMMETGGTAVAQAYYSAKHLGINDMIFAGLDLAYKNKTAYADGSEIEIENGNQIHVGSTIKNLTYVKDLNGNNVLSRDDYALFIRQFNDIFANDNTSKLYNTSNFGALINNMEYTDFNSVVSNLQDITIDTAGDMDKFRAECQEKWDNIYPKIVNILIQEKENFTTISKKTAELLDKEIKILNLIKDDPDNKDNNLKLKDLTNEFSLFIPEILNDAFLSQYFQSEFVNFINISSSATNQGLEAYVKLKNFEIQMLNGIIDICNIWIKFLDEKY